MWYLLALTYQQSQTGNYSRAATQELLQFSHCLPRMILSISSILLQKNTFKLRSCVRISHKRQMYHGRSFRESLKIEVKFRFFFSINSDIPNHKAD